jgi:hypothetical protein
MRTEAFAQEHDAAVGTGRRNVFAKREIADKENSHNAAILTNRLLPGMMYA